MTVWPRRLFADIIASANADAVRAFAAESAELLRGAETSTTNVTLIPVRLVATADEETEQPATKARSTVS